MDTQTLRRTALEPSTSTVPERVIGALVRDSLDVELRQRIDESMDRQLALFLGRRRQRHGVLAA